MLRRSLTALVFVFSIGAFAQAQVLTVEQANASGGNDFDQMRAITEGPNNSTIAVGATSSPAGSGTRTAPLIGQTDGLVLFFDADGNLTNEVVVGGSVPGLSSEIDDLYDVLYLEDYFYILGRTGSEPSGNKTAQSYGFEDVWLIKMDTLGNIIWDKSYGGSDFDQPDFIKLDHKQNLLIGAHSLSGASGVKTTTNYGEYDAWILRLDTAGTILNQYSFGGSGNDFPEALLVYEDGSVLLSVSSVSPADGNKSVANFGHAQYPTNVAEDLSMDAWLAHFDSSGNILSELALGGKGDDYITALFFNPDESITCFGESSSMPGTGTVTAERYDTAAFEASGNFALTDIWTVTIQPNQSLTNERFFGTGPNSFDGLTGVYNIIDGYRLLGGVGEGGPTSTVEGNSKGFGDLHVFEIDTGLNYVRGLRFGGGDSEHAVGMNPIASDRFLLIGNGNSQQGSGDVNFATYGESDVWAMIVKDTLLRTEFSASTGGKRFDKQQGMVSWDMNRDGFADQMVYETDENNMKLLIHTGTFDSRNRPIYEDGQVFAGWLADECFAFDLTNNGRSELVQMTRDSMRVFRPTDTPPGTTPTFNLDDDSLTLPPSIGQEASLNRQQVGFMDVDSDFNMDMVLTVASGVPPIKKVKSGHSTPLKTNSICDSSANFQQETELISSFPINVDPMLQPFDFDLDGDQDLLILHYDTTAVPDALHDLVIYENTNGSFTLNTNTGLDNAYANGFGNLADINNDGFIDILGSAPAGQMAMLYLGDGTGNFTLATSSTFKPVVGEYGDLDLLDINLDGRLDVVCHSANENDKLAVCLNQGNLNFIQSAEELNMNFDGKEGTASFWFDGDGDGDLDANITMHDSVKLTGYLRNNQQQIDPRDWVEVELNGCESGKDPLNSRVRVYSSAGTQAQMYNLRNLLQSQRDRKLHFGLGANASIDSVVVIWSSGMKTVVASPAANTTLVVNESDDCCFDEATGRESLAAAADVALVPNPSDGNFKLVVSEELLTQNASYELFSSTGQRIQHGALRNTEMEFSVDLPAGIYFIRILSDQQQLTKRLLLSGR